MVQPAVPEHEAQRLLTLKRYTLGDLSADQEFDRITRLAAAYCETPIALITLVDASHVWVKSGVGAYSPTALRQLSLCGEAILEPKLFEVSDARLDARLHKLPMVSEAPHVVFYAGMPLVADNGDILGTLCVMDHKPRQLSPTQRELLQQLASSTMLQFEHYLSQRAYQAIGNAAIGLWEMDVATRTTHWNDVVDALYQTNARQANTFEARMQAYTSADRARLVEAIDTAIAHGTPFNDIFEMQTPSGEPLWVRITGNPLAVDGQVVQLIGTMLDVTPRKKVETQLLRQQALEQAIARLSLVAKNTSNGVVITDARGNIEWINDGFTRLSGYTFAEAVGKKPGQLVQGKATDRATVLRIAHALRHRQHFEEELLNYRKDGTPYWVHISCNPLPANEQTGGGFIAIQSDITDTKLHEEALYKAANIDELTQLPNQRLARTQLEALVQHHAPLTISVLNIDDFKRLNDLFGYATGNSILRRVAKRLEALVSPFKAQGITARLSGDEFVLAGPTQRLTPSTIQHAIQQPLHVNGQKLKLTACIGMTTYPNDNVDPDALFRHAYQALYQAKTQGVAQCVRYSTDQEYLVKLRQQERSAIQHGLANDEFRLYYQPQVDLKSHTVVGAEALIRWIHPQHGLRNPAEFLPLLEGSELEFHLGEWVIEAALKQLQSWLAMGIELQVSVNISPQHLLHPGFLPQLEQLLLYYPQVPSRLLAIEILESATLDDMQAALHVLEECQRLGIEIALDDFGTGYSSLAYFRRLPVQLIKVDRDFVRDMLESEDDKAIVESIIFMARKFSRPVLAEGVETMEHAQALLAMGCHLAQGYGIARPMPADALPGWLETWQAEGFALP
ncbi:EAL domain-containing protein [Halomonas sp. BC2]|uniref:EAL domain-containing protein n=1 Tax=Halomonas sp. BC2 TaxID=1670449 RepID=UPI0009BF5796|nr:EAL domain-containing protein [Halomonas sp. BC2]